jgi:transposase InsO family protein
LHRPPEPAQYTSKDYAQLCDQLGVTLSLGGVGTSADNALAESFNATLKRETLARAATFTEPPRHVRRLRSLGWMESCQGTPHGSTRLS